MAWSEAVGVPVLSESDQTTCRVSGSISQQVQPDMASKVWSRPLMRSRPVPASASAASVLWERPAIVRVRAAISRTGEAAASSGSPAPSARRSSGCAARPPRA